jgi:cytochrome oxidase assembly protein ShyY1
MQSEALPLERTLQPNAARPGVASYHRVVVTGHYDPSHQALIQFRSYSGEPGEYLMTPVVTADGSAILVNRGWIPLSNTPVSQARGLDPPRGDVQVTGILFPSEKGGPAPTDEGDGLIRAPRINLPMLAPGFTEHLYPAYVQLTAQEPHQAGDYPIVLPLPHLDDGPHLSYAIQWFCFTAIGLIGWPILLRRSVREREREHQGEGTRLGPPGSVAAPS